MGDFIVTVILRGGIYALMAVGLSLVFGVMNIPSFSHGEHYMLGAYFAYFAYAKFGMSPLLAIAVAAVLSFVFGAVIELVVFAPLRRRNKKNWQMGSFIVTLGISFILMSGARILWGSNTRGVTEFFPGKVYFGTFGMANDRIVGFAIAVFAIIAFMLFLKYSRLGCAIRAVSMDETGASLTGVNLGFVYTLTFALSCMLAGIAGACLLSILPATPGMGLNPLYKSWFILILIGMGNIGGCIVGGLIVSLLETIAIYTLGIGWQDLMSLSIIILILLFKPNGIFGKKGVKTINE
jgi:branched-chain amino acid transport system permease protein